MKTQWLKEDGIRWHKHRSLWIKEGVYKYIITEKAGTDSEVDYDGMRVTATVTVKEKKDASVNVEFDFTKKLSGRNLKSK